MWQCRVVVCGGRSASTHGDVLNVHTEAFWSPHTGARDRGKEEKCEEKEKNRVLTCTRGGVF